MKHTFALIPLPAGHGHETMCSYCPAPAALELTVTLEDMGGRVVDERAFALCPVHARRQSRALHIAMPEEALS